LDKLRLSWLEATGERKLAILDSQLEEIKKQILIMGGYVEKAMTDVVSALMSRNVENFASIHQIEKKINEDHKKIDNACMGFLAKQGPVAKDLRMVLAIIKINTDLERMGDQAVNIAYTGKDYLGRKPLQNLKEIARMSEIVRDMVRQALDSFVQSNTQAAQKVIEMDDSVDEIKNSVLKQMAAHIKQNPEDTEAALDIILMARNFERLGDHATNIAEDVIFVCTGKDIRHGGA
jgi:phosphate transport system protein